MGDGEYTIWVGKGGVILYNYCINFIEVYL